MMMMKLSVLCLAAIVVSMVHADGYYPFHKRIYYKGFYSPIFSHYFPIHPGKFYLPYKPFVPYYGGHYHGLSHYGHYGYGSHYSSYHPVHHPDQSYTSSFDDVGSSVFDTSDDD